MYLAYSVYSVLMSLITSSSCGNLVKQKYLKIHQKNHCVGIRTSTFANFRTAVSKVGDV